MQQRKLGTSGLSVSVLGFGCGGVGGLMVRGSPADQERAVASALAHGITYFDTASSYGDGESECNLGRVLATLKPDIRVGTKVRLDSTDHIGAGVFASLEASLKRLGRDSVDLFQLHNAVARTGGKGALTPRQVLEEVVPAFEKLRDQGKTRCFGITAVGEAEALHEVIAAGTIHSAQMPYNLLNSSATASLPPLFPAQDYRQLMLRAHEKGIGTIGIRVLAAGALSGEETRHPIAAQNVAPIASGASYAADLARAKLFRPLVAEGHASSLVEAALRFAISADVLSTVLIGIATLEQFEYAVASVNKGPLSPTALARVAEVQRAIAS